MKPALKFKAGTSISIVLKRTQWILACLLILAELKAQFFSDLIYMKEKRCSTALVSQNLLALSLQGKVILLTANVMELQGRCIPTPMLSLMSFIDLDK